MTRLSDAAFLAGRALRTVKVVYGGSEFRASFKSGEVYREDENGRQTAEVGTTLLVDAVVAEDVSLTERTDIEVYPVEDDEGTPTTYRIRQIRLEVDGLFKRVVIAA